MDAIALALEMPSGGSEEHKCAVDACPGRREVVVNSRWEVRECKCAAVARLAVVAVAGLKTQRESMSRVLNVASKRQESTYFLPMGLARVTIHAVYSRAAREEMLFVKCEWEFGVDVMGLDGQTDRRNAQVYGNAGTVPW